VQDFIVDVVSRAIRTWQVLRLFRRSIGIHVLVPGQWIVSGRRRSSKVPGLQTVDLVAIQISARLKKGVPKKLITRKLLEAMIRRSRRGREDDQSNMPTTLASD
jgi:hypothetical protein